MKKILICTLLLLASPVIYANANSEKHSGQKAHEQSKEFSSIFDSSEGDNGHEQFGERETDGDSFLNTHTANRGSDDAYESEFDDKDGSKLHLENIDLTPQAVPENQTYKLMAMGLVMMGFTMWRRKSS